MLLTSSTEEIIPVFQQGGLFAYPTEAVYGIGCDPENEAAVTRLLALKQRPLNKGLILVAADISQVTNYLKLQPGTRRLLLAPSDTTYVFPASKQTPVWLTGDFDTLAVRISKHPLVHELCLVLESAIVSTSANMTGQPPAMDFDAVQQLARQLPETDTFDAILKGETMGQQKPSRIVDAISGTILRA